MWCMVSLANKHINGEEIPHTSMELSPFREVTWYSTTKEFPKYFIEAEVSLPCSQEPAIIPYPDPDESSPYLFLKNLF
jgi:hypothetical protein